MEAGDVIDDALVYMKVAHATAVIQVGVVVSTVFYPVVEATNAIGWVKLGFASTLAELYLKSNIADAEAEIVLQRVVAPV